MGFLTEKTVLVTGGAGTVGRELVDQILDQGPREVRVVDVNESEVFFVEQAVEGRIRRQECPPVSCNCFVGDVRDADKLMMLCDGVDVVFHAAALKHVILCERSPFDSVQTNIIGVKNVINAALHHDVERVIFTSSDKAVNPTNVMGTSKLMGERLITAANSLKVNSRTVFSSTRFGNVLGSRGSVAPLFYRQIRAGGPVTLTDHRMTRFFMSLAESCRLVLDAAEMARGGEVFITKMPVLRIDDLAAVMIEMLAPRFGYTPSAIPLETIGMRPGEKLYEELMSHEETRRTVELERMFAVLPAFRSVYQDICYDYPGIVCEEIGDPYVSSQREPLGRTEIRRFLEDERILEGLEQEGAVRAEDESTPLKKAA